MDIWILSDINALSVCFIARIDVVYDLLKF